ncbi:hypothetical protein F443_02743 [Phytophthora nicotianae P1569]|uniref:ZSWIM1/3 RNaseH-like domain-containing protein n=1 Tax=Phytophthora nicotianae P1569 TaxID=1317065 RepID=V9FUK6_PHYNI|nr:hypothetical protein F443_02743 [Phytophthora nicotianae P1569]
MGRFFEAFPEVVMVASTNGTNAAKYKLFSFMIDDAFGHGSTAGQYVQHALVENESHACMKDAITAFKENNPSWDRIRAFMVAKDFGEISVLQRESPLARVLICHFHLKKYLRTEMSKAIYGGLHGVDVDRVEDSLDMTVKARNKEEYDRGFRASYRSQNTPFLIISFEAGTLARKCGLCTGGAMSPTSGITPTTAWGALKDILKPEMELDECVETLHFMQSTAELEYASRFNVLGSRNYHGADEMLLRLAALMSPHAFELVRKEYESYKNGSLSYEVVANIYRPSEDAHNRLRISCGCFDLHVFMLLHADYVASVSPYDVCTGIDG